MQQQIMEGPRGGGGLTRASFFEELRDAVPARREEAWERFSSMYRPMIAGFARRCGAGEAEAEDIVQDVMTAFLQVSGAFAYDPARGRFRGWLKTCTVRIAVRRAGKRLSLGGRPLGELPETELAVEPVWNDVWEEQLVAAALKQLRAEAGESVAFRAFDAYVLQESPAEQVAAGLGTSVANVHQAKTRMTRRLREIVGDLRERAG